MFRKSYIIRDQLKNKFREAIPNKLKELKQVREQFGDKKLGEITVSQVLGGMRGMNALFYDGSKLDAEKGIMLRGRNLFDLCEHLKYRGSEEPVAESLLWYLFTGEFPNDSQTEFVIHDLHRRATQVDFEHTESL